MEYAIDNFFGTDIQILINNWYSAAKIPSGNYTSNLPMPDAIINKLLKNEIKTNDLKESLITESIKLHQLTYPVSKYCGFQILAYLQNLYLPNCLTVYRAIRFPTPNRINEMVKVSGLSTINFEHERLLSIYEDSDYKLKREQLLKDPAFSFQPQERIVQGLPVFLNVNDAVQIHRPFRLSNKDYIAIAVSFIPYDLLSSDKIQMFSNQALVQNYFDNQGDRKITHYKFDPLLRVKPSFSLLRLEGIQLYESYLVGFPHKIEDCIGLDISTKFYLLEIENISSKNDDESLKDIKIDKNIMGDHSYFLYGFWGDDNIFLRRPSEYLATKCIELAQREK